MNVSNTEPYLPIAEALAGEIDRLLEGDDNIFPAVNAEEALDVALKKVAEDIITKRLEQMDPLEVLKLYAERADDKEIAGKLGAWATAQARSIGEKNKRTALANEAVRTGRLSLEDLDRGDFLKISLFKVVNANRAFPGSGLPPSRVISLRLLEPKLGLAEIVSDIATPHSGSMTTFSEQTTAVIGTKVLENGEEKVSGFLNVKGHLSYQFADDIETTPEITGYVESGNGDTLLYAKS